ncbi:MAG: zinc ribbon domain-containing protein, partial [Tissierellia bacterium]|nr:zinc ribbon domain-containing protein [Tissierellia bacterium]
EGELPMYWAENTHPKIIELETYNKVQEEIKRRRELGALANWSINTSCFTSKIHCSCGRNFQRSQRNQAGRKYAVWMCAGQKEANRKGCTNPSMPEYILKNKCAEVLNLKEFNEKIFSDKVSDINVLEPGLLEFVYMDGKKEKVSWKSTARKDWWTDEARRKYAKLRQTPEFSRSIERFNEFSSFIKCEKCGLSYRRQKSKYTNGDIKVSYHCPTPASKCKNSSIHLPALESLVANELNLDHFDSKVMTDTFSKLGIKDHLIYFYYKDGIVTSRHYENPIRERPKHTEETKKKIGKGNKESWRKRHEENNDDTGN